MAALCSLLPFLYFFIFLFRARICFSSADSTFFSFLIPFRTPALFAFLTLLAIFLFRAAIFFMAAFFAFLTRRAILRFRAAIFFMAALCSLLPFLYFFIFLFRARICFSSADSTFFSFLI